MVSKRRGRIVVLAATAVATAVLATGCGSSSDNGGGSGSAAKAQKVSVLLFSRGFEFMVALDQATRKEGKAKGLDVTVLDGKGDTNTQIGQIDDAIAAGAKGILLSPNDSQQIVPGVVKANQANVPLVTTDAIAAGGNVAAHVGFDNVAGGRMAADELCKRTGGKGAVLELTGALGEYHAVNRQKGFEDEMKAKCPSVTVIRRNANWQADQALSITVDNLTKNKSINGIFSHNDEMIRGVVSGLRQVGRTAKVGQPGHVAIVGIDGTPSALDRIRQGVQDASVQQDPFVMGKMAIDGLWQAMNGQQPTKMTQLPPKLITKKNVDDPSLWANQFKG